jgi:tRNA pseudouridine32 synthase/23S rRNA pseudouridine746 synthase
LVAGLELQKIIKARADQSHGTILPCHRLDFEVSGLLIFAKNEIAHKAANSWFEKKLIKKTYRTLTEGSIIEANNWATPQIVKSKLLRGKKRAFESPHGQDAETHVQFIKQNSDGFLEWNLNPITGRSHQLRYEMSRLKFPILGDKLYGSQYQLISPTEITLQAVAIDFSEISGIQDFQLPAKIEIPFRYSQTFECKPSAAVV